VCAVIRGHRLIGVMFSLCRDEQTEPSDVINCFHTGQPASLFPLCHFLKYTQRGNTLILDPSAAAQTALSFKLLWPFFLFSSFTLLCFALHWLRVPVFYINTVSACYDPISSTLPVHFLRVVEHLEQRSNGPVVSVCTLGWRNARVRSGESTLR